MRFPLKKKEIIRASLFGLCTGIIGVLIFVILLNSVGKNSNQKSDEQLSVSIDTTSQNTKLKEGTFEQFFALQHGVFSSFQAASDYIATNEKLNVSAIFEINQQYYVWSSIATTKEDLPNIDESTSFTKPFKLSGASCKKSEIQNLPTILKNNDEKFYFEGKIENYKLPSDWVSINSALSSLSRDIPVIRMHLLAHYYSKNNCLKINF